MCVCMHACVCGYLCVCLRDCLCMVVWCVNNSVYICNSMQLCAYICIVVVMIMLLMCRNSSTFKSMEEKVATSYASVKVSCFFFSYDMGDFPSAFFCCCREHTVYFVFFVCMFVL